MIILGTDRFQARMDALNTVNKVNKKEDKQMLSFVDALKRVIADIEATGGAIIERTFPSHQLLQQLREYTVRDPSQLANAFYTGEWSLEGYLEERVRACVVYLHKFGISNDNRVYRLITKVIDSIKGHTESREELNDSEKIAVQSLEVVWFEYGDEQTYLYRTAESRWLITWDYQKSQWRVTGLGRFFMNLAPMEATIFLLSIDTLFATSEYDFHHISSNMLRRLQSLKSADNMQCIEKLDDPHHTLLMRLSIFIKVRPGVDWEEGSSNYVQMTLIGQMVINAVLSESNFYRDAALSLVRTEEVGGTFSESASEISEMVRLVNQSDFVDQVNRESIDTSVQLHRIGKHLASFKIICPSMEAILEMMLISVGISERLNGLVEKAKRLSREGNIPPDVAGGIEIIAKVRNPVIHGSISPPDDDARLLCQLAFQYLRRLLTTYHSVK